MSRSIGRVRWQPSKAFFWTGSRRRCQRCTSLLGGEAVLEEVQGAAGTQHAPDLGEGAVDVGDRAQRERREDGVGARVREAEPLAVEVAADDGDGAAGAAVGSELPRDVGGLDGDDAA